MSVGLKAAMNGKASAIRLASARPSQGSFQLVMTAMALPGSTEADTALVRSATAMSPMTNEAAYKSMQRIVHAEAFGKTGEFASRPDAGRQKKPAGQRARCSDPFAARTAPALKAGERQDRHSTRSAPDVTGGIGAGSMIKTHGRPDGSSECRSSARPLPSVARRERNGAEPPAAATQVPRSIKIS